jgi:hypothetical protein
MESFSFEYSSEPVPVQHQKESNRVPKVLNMPGWSGT